MLFKERIFLKEREIQKGTLIKFVVYPLLFKKEVNTVIKDSHSIYV